MAHKKFVSNLNSTMMRGAFALVVALSASIISSCGGSGGGVASTTPLVVGTLDILPDGANVYGGVPFILTIAGGTKPYFLTSSEQTLIPLNITLNTNELTLVANNPGVVDVGSDPNVVPFRSVNVTVRDAAGKTKTSVFKVLQNFLTGYGLSVTSIGTCGNSGCAGFESIISLRPTSAGLIQVNRQLSLSIVQGNYSFFANPNAAPNTPGSLVQTVTTTTSPTGTATARLFVPVNALTQYAILRVTDVISGSYQDLTFVIAAVPTQAMAALPPIVPALTGSNTQNCGSGSTNIIITGGTPPYRATTTSTLITVSPTILSASGGSYTVNISGGSPPNCTNGSVLISDSANPTVNITVGVSSVAGATAPVLPLAISPASLCIADGSTGNAVVTGGGATIVLNSGNTGLLTAANVPAMTMTAVGFAPATCVVTPVTIPPTVSTCKVGGGLGVFDGVAVPAAVVNVTATDGATSATISVTRKATCP